MSSKTKDVAKTNTNLPDTVDQVQFQMMQMQKGEIAEILRENLGEDSLSVQDLPRIVVPGSGGKIWTVPSVEGDVEMSDLVGIIVFTKVTRTYWEKSFDDTGGGEPPDCYSPDGVLGVGIIADSVKDHMCGNCPMSEFAKDGTGCPCKESRLIFMVMQDEILPVVIKAPVMSLKNAKKYLTGLTSRRQKVHSVYSTLTLEPDKNKRGIKYSKIMFSKSGDVENPALSAGYAEALRPFIDKAAAKIAQEGRPSYENEETVNV
jgi:hypothetical protein